MKTNKTLLLRGMKYLGITVALMFAAPFIVHQAFKNQGHPFYLPVLVVGIIFAVAAMVLGFYSIKTVVDAIFGKKK